MLAILWRDLKIQYTRVFWLIANFCSPLFYLFFFALMFSSSMSAMDIDGLKINYLKFFLPGLIIFQSFSVFQTTFTLVHLDRRLKILETIKNTNTTITEYFFAKAISAQLLAFAKALLVYLMGIIFFGLEFSAAKMAGLALILIVSNALWFNFGFILGISINTEEKRDIFQQLFMLPIVFLSTIYYPNLNAPYGLALIVRANPLTAACNIARSVLLDIHTSSRQDFIYLIAYLLLSFCAAWIFFRFKRKEFI